MLIRKKTRKYLRFARDKAREAITCSVQREAKQSNKKIYSAQRITRRKALLKYEVQLKLTGLAIK